MPYGSGSGTQLGGSQTYVVPSGGDDSAGIAAAAPDIGLRAGTYKVTAGVRLLSQAIIQGRGMADAGFTTALTKIQCAVDAINVLRVDAFGAVLEKFAIQWTGVGTPTSGTGLYLGANDGMRVQDVAVKGFFNNFVLGGFYWTARGLLSVDAVNWGVYVTNSVIDHGDAMLSDSFILAGPNNNGAAALHWDAGGGLQVQNVKVSAPLGSSWTNGIEFVFPAAGSTTEIGVSDSVVDQFTQKGIYVAALTGGTTFAGLLFDNVHVRGSANPVNGYYIRGSGTGGGVADVTITGGEVILGTNALSCIDIDNAGRVTIADVELGGIPAASTLVTLGAGVQNAKVTLGTIRPPASQGNTWTTGTNQHILHNAATTGTPVGGGGSEYVMSFRHPTITSNSVFSTLWQFGAFAARIEFDLFCVNPTGGNMVVVHQERLWHDVTGNGVLTQLGTDTASSTDIDIQWTSVSATLFQIAAKINAGSAITSLGGTLFSRVRITGAVQDIWGYA